jgi:eukaryotic-like serine/threonine-protein kinase
MYGLGMHCKRKPQTVFGLLSILVSLLLSSSLLSATNASEQTNPKNNSTSLFTYQNPAYGIKIQYPSDWRVSENGLRDYTNIVAFYSPLENVTDRVPEHLTLSRIDYSQNITLDQYNKFLNSTLKNISGVQILESNPITLAGHQGRDVVYLSTPSSLPFKFQDMLIWTIIGGKVYSLSFSAEAGKYSTVIPTIQKMINSFRITR